VSKKRALSAPDLSDDRLRHVLVLAAAIADIVQGDKLFTRARVASAALHTPKQQGQLAEALGRIAADKTARVTEEVSKPPGVPNIIQYHEDPKQDARKNANRRSDQKKRSP
jgi:hypothetical protein